jgi:hypothetical protein
MNFVIKKVMCIRDTPFGENAYVSLVFFLQEHILISRYNNYTTIHCSSGITDAHSRFNDLFLVTAMLNTTKTAPEV